VEAWHQVARTPSDALVVLRVERIQREMARNKRSRVWVKLRPWRWCRWCSHMEKCGGGRAVVREQRACTVLGVGFYRGGGEGKGQTESLGGATNGSRWLTR
jgi:hypothetical protein